MARLSIPIIYVSLILLYLALCVQGSRDLCHEGWPVFPLRTDPTTANKDGFVIRFHHPILDASKGFWPQEIYEGQTVVMRQTSSLNRPDYSGASIGGWGSLRSI